MAPVHAKKSRFSMRSPLAIPLRGTPKFPLTRPKSSARHTHATLGATPQVAFCSSIFNSAPWSQTVSARSRLAVTMTLVQLAILPETNCAREEVLHPQKRSLNFWTHLTCGRKTGRGSGEVGKFQHSRMIRAEAILTGPRAVVFRRPKTHLWKTTNTCVAKRTTFQQLM